MKRKILIIIIAFFLISSLNAQITVFTLDVNKHLTEISIPSLIVSKDLSSTPRLFTIQILPERVEVVLKGEIIWEKPNGGSKLLYYFRTAPFLSRMISNQDIGSGDLRIADDGEGEKDAFKEILEKGKPTGKIIIKVILIDPKTGLQLKPQQTEEIVFLNPSKSFEIISPRRGEIYDAGNILAEWSKTGVDNYRIKAAVRRNSSQSLEEALNSNDPLIDAENITNNIVALRTLLRREWLPGQEIVLQVTAISILPNGKEELYSTPVNFFIGGNSIENNNYPALLEKLLESGNIEDLENLEIDEIIIDGQKISKNELMVIIKYLKDNPDLIISKKFIRR